ncbi:PRC-barrel domain-containing protein [Falsirhodobacter deserti]|uniref:PRC-barrel domain-containing protein n=1 Tax=Falsirhodobacter deserti TaxID=1365611 RepID=UPI0013E32095|nr:PRC-barrel domain-containing protein [Falsirhodobacter deserti]
MNKFALSTAILALTSGMALAQTTAPAAPEGNSTTTPPVATEGTSTTTEPMAPEGDESTTATGQEQAPLTGNSASPTESEVDTGDEGGEPATESMSEPDAAAPDTTTTTNSADAQTSSTITPPEGYEPVMMEQLNAEMLADASIYDAEDSAVGTVSEVTPEQGMPEQVVLDVGGFLGIGAKPVALNVSELTFFQQTDGEEVRGYTSMTEDQLKDLPEYEG